MVDEGSVETDRIINQFNTGVAKRIFILKKVQNEEEEEEEEELCEEGSDSQLDEEKVGVREIESDYILG